MSIFRSGSAAVILNRAVLLFCVFFGNFLLEESGLAHMQTACSGSNSDRGLLWLLSLCRRCQCPHIFFVLGCDCCCREMFKVQFDWIEKSPSLACAGHMKSLESLPHPQSAAWLTKVEEELGPRRMPGTVQGRTLHCQSGIALLTSLKRKKGQECGAFAERVNNFRKGHTWFIWTTNVVLGAISQL